MNLYLIIQTMTGRDRVIGPFENVEVARDWYKLHGFDRRVEVIGGSFVTPLHPDSEEAQR